MTTTTDAESIRITGIDLTGYMTKDYDRAIAFYRDVLSMEPTKEYPDKGGAEFTFADGATFGLWNPGDSMPFQTNNGILFATEDLGVAKRALAKHGVPIVMEHETGVCTMLMCMDPDGNAVILHKRKPGND